MSLLQFLLYPPMSHTSGEKSYIARLYIFRLLRVSVVVIITIMKNLLLFGEIFMILLSQNGITLIIGIQMSKIIIITVAIVIGLAALGACVVIVTKRKEAKVGTEDSAKKDAQEETPKAEAKGSTDGEKSTLDTEKPAESSEEASLSSDGENKN